MNAFKMVARCAERQRGAHLLFCHLCEEPSPTYLCATCAIKEALREDPVAKVKAFERTQLPTVVNTTPHFNEAGEWTGFTSRP